MMFTIKIIKMMIVFITIIMDSFYIILNMYQKLYYS